MFWAPVGALAMQALHALESRALRLLLDGQPMTPAKAAFAWRIAAGPTLAGATRAEVRPDGRLLVRAQTEVWRRELRRARPLLLARLQELLGPEVIRSLVIEGS